MTAESPEVGISREKSAIIHRNNSIKPSRGGGGLFKTRPSREGAYSRGGRLIQKSGKYVAKEPKKCLEVLKNELDKMAIKLNPGFQLYQTGHRCDHAKNMLKNF